jgi:HK97 family phage major capsid protein
MNGPSTGRRFRIFADTPPTLEELRERLITLHAKAISMQELADAEKRLLTEKEDAEVQGYFAAFEQTEIEIQRREKLQVQEARLAKANPRVTEPALVGAQGAQAAVKDPPPASTRSPITGELVSAMAGNNGFRSMGEFALAVKTAAEHGTVDARLRPLAATAGTISQEQAGADGGYLVPPDFRTVVMVKVTGEDALLARCDQLTTTSNAVTMPVDETTPWQYAGGIQVYWEGEGSTFPQSKVALRSVTLRASNLVALLQVTDELLEDAPSLNAYMARKIPDKLNFKINDAILNGDGVGKPLGIFNSPALITQAAETSQTAGTINFTNILKMWSRVYAPLRRDAVWLINQDVEPQLYGMVIPSAAGVSAPAYIAPGGLPNAPNGTILGRPIVYSEATKGVGTPGDIALIDFSQYLALMKSGGVRADSSIHLWFDQGLVAFRFTMRIGGLPWWSSSIVRANSSNPLSFAVVLAQR